MKNCLVLGSGRSGTSMVAGSLAHAGYFMGEMYMRAAPGNPRGYFEGRDINDINERILAKLVPSPPFGPVGRLLYPRGFRHGQRWLARLPIASQIVSDPEIDDAIKQILKNAPFCLKDPRFCYTLPAWRKYLPDDTVFVCVFRDPARTADSILRECSERPYLHNLRVDAHWALDVWRHMYEHILTIHRHEGEWLFLHYDQVVNGDGLEQLSKFLDAPVDRTFPEQKISRAAAALSAPPQATDLYHQLCELADYAGDRRG